MLSRGDYWQCGFVIPKGGFDQIQARALVSFREEIARLAPCLRERTAEPGEWSDVKLLSVSVDWLRAWHKPGVLCIGDAAHAMSPVGGVGINLAFQDAVAAANILAFAERPPRGSAAARVSDACNAGDAGADPEPVIDRVLGGTGELSAPLLVRLFRACRS